MRRHDQIIGSQSRQDQIDRRHAGGNHDATRATFKPGDCVVQS
jgi:hypothetical protein